MKYTKIMRTTTVNHLIGDTDAVAEGKPSDMALHEFERKDTVNVGEGKFVPFHAVDSVAVVSTSEEGNKLDPFCVKGCESMADPSIMGDMSEITVTAGEEFDPLEGITAEDDNGQEVEVTVSVVEGD